MTKEEFKRWVEQHSIECKDGIDKAYEAFKVEVKHYKHYMDHLADCVPYNDPYYYEKLRNAAEQYVKNYWNPNSELNIICREYY